MGRCSEEGRNNYIPTEVHWSEVPGRDAEMERRNNTQYTSESQFNSEFECEFLGFYRYTYITSKIKTD